jgi:hypothetical protein
MIGVPSSDDHNSSLHIGRGRRLWVFIAWPGRWPRLARVLADEGGQNFHDSRVIPGRVAGDTLQGVDGTDPHVEFAGSQLLDGLGIAVGHLTLLAQNECAT